MHYLSGKDLLGLSAPTALIAAVEQALRDYAAGKVTVPVRGHLHFGENTLLTMPVVGEGAFGAKVVSVIPSNAGRNLPTIHGLMVLSDGETGAPLAVMDAAVLTAQRTGAVGALGVKYMTPADVDSVGIIGTGVQAIWQAISVCAVRPIRTIHFSARSDDAAQWFVQAVSPRVPSVQLCRCADVQELIGKTQVVIAATSASRPVLPADAQRLRGKHFVSVGSYKPAMQELPDCVYELAGKVVIDSEAAKVEAGDLVGPLSAGIVREENVFHLAELVVGRRSLDTSATTAFKSVGLALYDLYAARAFLSEAQRLGRGTVLED